MHRLVAANIHYPQISHLSKLAPVILGWQFHGPFNKYAALIVTYEISRHFLPRITTLTPNKPACTLPSPLRLDTQKRGFLTSVDWGCLDFNSVIEMFSLLYMRKYMGLPDTSATDDDVSWEQAYA